MPLPSNCRIENTASSIVVGLFGAAETYVPRRCLAIAAFIRSIVPALSRHVTLLPQGCSS
jgi:hypothetical protein